MKNRTPLALLLAGLTALASCSSSSGTPGTADDLPGAWKVWIQEPGRIESGPFTLYLSTAGTKITAIDLSGEIEGSTFEFTAVLLDGVTNATGFLNSPTTAIGTYTTLRNGLGETKGSFRMAKFNPTGTVSINGSVLGQVITHESTSATGVRKYLDPDHTILVEVEIVTGSPLLNFELDLDPRNLAVGTLQAGKGAADVAAAIEFSTGLTSARAEAIGGEFLVTAYDNSGLQATFSLDLDSGDTVTGKLDVKFDLEALHPYGSAMLR